MSAIVSLHIESDVLTGVCTVGGTRDDGALLAFVIVPDAVAVAFVVMAVAAGIAVAALATNEEGTTGRTQKNPRRSDARPASSLQRALLVVTVALLQVLFTQPI